MCYKSAMSKIVELWLLFKYVGLEFTLLSKPFKTREQAEKAREKYPERMVPTVGTRRDLYRVHIRPVAITSLDYRRCYNYRNTVDSFMIKDEIFTGARQPKPLHLCLCVIKRERRFLPAELTAIELPIDLERASHGQSLALC